MKILSYLKSFYYSVKNGWYAGKGSKCLKKNDWQAAIEYLTISLHCSERTNNQANVAFAHQVLASAHLGDEQYDLAEEHIRKSGEIYTRYLKGNDIEVFAERLRNTEKILTKIRYKQALKLHGKTAHHQG